MKTNAVRMLEQAGIHFEIKEYVVDENDLSGEHVAHELGLPPQQVFKTLVLKGDDFFVCCIPSDGKIDLKKASRAAGAKHAAMIPMKDLRAVTGYIRGGCSPVGMKKAFSTFLDETCILYDRICVSAGIRGAMIVIAPADLMAFLGAKEADLIME